MLYTEVSMTESHWLHQNSLAVDCKEIIIMIYTPNIRRNNECSQLICFCIIIFLKREAFAWIFPYWCGFVLSLLSPAIRILFTEAESCRGKKQGFPPPYVASGQINAVFSIIHFWQLLESYCPIHPASEIHTLYLSSENLLCLQHHGPPCHLLFLQRQV